MEITLPQTRRGMPSPDEMVRNVSILCESAGFRADMAKLAIVGGNHLGEHKGVGIRLCRPEQFSALIFVGCKENTALAYLTVKGSDNRAIRGEELFSSLARSCNPKRILMITEQMIRDYERRHSVTDTTNGKISASPVPPVISLPARVTEPAPSVAPEAEPVAVVPPSAPSSLEIGTPVLRAAPSGKVYAVTTHVAAPNGSAVHRSPPKGYFFDDPHNLHMTATALALIVKNDPNIPFNIYQLRKAMEDSHVPKEAGIPASVIRMLALRKFVTRLNPGGEPSLYCITQQLIDFVAADPPARIEQPQTKKEKEAPVREVAPSVIVPTPVVDMKSRLSELKSQESREKGLREAARTLTSTIVEIQAQNLDQQQKNVEAEIASLEKRLSALHQELSGIDATRDRLAAALKDRDQMERELDDPVLRQALQELADIRALIG